jgi:hypothetical protein
MARSRLRPAAAPRVPEVEISRHALRRGTLGLARGREADGACEAGLDERNVSDEFGHDAKRRPAAKRTGPAKQVWTNGT